MINTRPVLRQKFRLIVIPFILTALGYLVVYTFIHWLLLVKFQQFHIKEDYLDLLIPFIIPWIASLTWLGRRIRLLQLMRKGRDRGLALQMITAFAITAPMVVAQAYLKTASGSLTSLQNIKEIVMKPASKYYTISRYFIDTANAGVAYTSDISGKYNNYLNLHIYICSPIYDAFQQPTKIGALGSSPDMAGRRISKGPLILLDGYKIDSTVLLRFPKDSILSIRHLNGARAAKIFGDDGLEGVIFIRTIKAERNFEDNLMDSITPPPPAWCCVKYYEQISNKISSEKKEEAFHAFYDQSIAQFRNIHMRDMTYLERTGYNDNLVGFKKAIRKTHLAKDSAVTNILEPKFTAYSDRNGNKLPWIFGTLAISSVIWFAVFLAFPFDNEKLGKFLAGKPQKESGDLKELGALFIPRQGYYVTPILVNLNILVFIVMAFAGLGLISFSSYDLLSWGANYRPKVAEGQWWRLLTSVFLHGGIYHLVANMVALIFIGTMLEPELGAKRMVLCYLITGICASLASIWWNEAVVSVGASGAIFGLYGIFVTQLLTGVNPVKFNKGFLLIMFVFIGINLFVGISGGIDNAAHIGGLLSGGIIGLLIGSVLRNRDSEDSISTHP